MKTIILSALAVTSLGAAGAVAAQTAPAPTAAATAKPAHYTTTDTEFGVLWDNPQTKAIIVANLPELGKPEAADGLQMARSMTLRTLQQVKPDFFTEEKLAAIDVQLAKVPVK